MAKWTYDEGGEGQTGGDSGGGGGTPAPVTGNQPAPVELKIFRLDSEGQNNVLVFSDFLNPLTNQFTISADDVADFGDGTYRARIGDVFSNDFTIALTEIVPPPIPQGTINPKHYKFTPQRNIVETVIKEINANSVNDIGQIMPIVMKRGKGLVDGNIARQIVVSLLSK